MEPTHCLLPPPPPPPCCAASTCRDNHATGRATVVGTRIDIVGAVVVVVVAVELLEEQASQCLHLQLLLFRDPSTRDHEIHDFTKPVELRLPFTLRHLNSERTPGRTRAEHTTTLNTKRVHVCAHHYYA